MIKPKGYTVFPSDVEDHISAALPGRVANVGVVGVEHAVFSEAIIAFIEAANGGGLTPEHVHDACLSISAYSRPAHVEIVSPGDFPLNRVAKTDYLVLRERAAAVVDRLRLRGLWDAV